jgi:hypothetical protein
LSEQRAFEDSKNSLGLQLADMLSAILRRALNNKLQYEGWKNFGKLLIEKLSDESSYIQLGPGDMRIKMQGHAKKVGRILLASARPMLVERL